MAAPATDAPSQIMMLSSLVRLPLNLHQRRLRAARRDAGMGTMAVAAVAALIQRRSDPGRVRRRRPISPVPLDIAALVGFAVLFLVAARYIHRLTRDKAR